MIDPLDYYGSDFDGWYSRQLAVETRKQCSPSAVYSQGLADSTSALSELECDASGKLKSTPTVRRS